MNKIDLQKKVFLKLGLSYDEGLELFNKIYLEKIPELFKPSSQRQILFSSISLKKNKNNFRSGDF